jgi:chromosome segregation protein
MYISELELQGFKSFAYKTEVKFDSGITAIVGPNGCGKSNIVDSLRWVLGEQRPTLLRSANMSNVIFNGTSKKKALGMAEVSLTLQNNKGVLPTEFSEVTITRRLYRSGESEYLINNSVCRLKDIMELFMDTGMGSDAYSVIELKMVEEILNDKNNDRRKLFEEAAGVTKYKDKRKKTFRKLEETKKDLQRVEDILIEVRKKVHSLQVQAGKARRAKEYNEELYELDQGLSFRQYHVAREKLDPVINQIKEAKREKYKIADALDELEEEVEKAHQTLQDKEKHQSDAQKRVAQIGQKVQEAKSSLLIAQNQIKNEQNVIDQYEQDIEQAKSDLADMRDLLERTGAQLDADEKELKRAKRNLEQSQEKYKEIQQAYNEKRNTADQLDQQITSTNNELNQLRTTQVKHESRLENTEGDLQRIETEIEDLQDELENAIGEQSLLKKQLDKLTLERDEAEENIEQARQKKEDLGHQQEQLRDQLRSQQSKLDSVTSEKELLLDLAKSNEAFPGSVSYLKEECADQFSRLDLLSDVISTTEEYAVALESVLGDALNYLVVDSLDEAKKAARLLKEADEGRATFIPLDQLSDNHSAPDQSLAAQVQCDSALKGLRNMLLGDVQVIDDVDEGFGSNGSFHTAVTRDGQVINRYKFLQSGSQRKDAGIRVGLEDKIEKLDQRAEQIRTQIEQGQQELQALQEQQAAIDIQALTETYKEKQQTVRQKEHSINRHASHEQIYEKNIGELENRKKQLLEQEEQARRELDQLFPKQKELQNKLRELADQQSTVKKELSSLEEERSIAQNRFNDARLSHQDLSNKVSQHHKEIERAENGIQSIKKRIETRADKNEQSKKRIVELNDRVEVLEDQVVRLDGQKDLAEKKLEEAEEATGKQRTTIKEMEDQLRQVRRKKEVNTDLIHSLEKTKHNYEFKIKGISDHVWEQYNILIDQIEARLPEDADTDEVKERVTSLKQKLKNIGEVNPLAIKEYEEEKKRLDFYETQINDLLEAEEKLETTIQEINETATERFNVTFEQIRKNFIDVFKTLFHEDDYCDLLIEQDVEDPLEAKINIVANPKGKKPSNINQLSGGEKTLTAIALLFAIYLVKPSPFCVLDEVDAPLDDANIERFANMIKRFSDETQFIIITHNKNTMSKAEMMYGVTMPETGVSRLVGVRLDEVEEISA